MGQSEINSQIINMLKFAIVVCCAAFAAAEAEAKPEAKADAYYPYAYGAYPYAYGAYAYGAYPYSYGYYGKRSAEAEPEADADAYYGYPYGYRSYGYRAYGYGYPYRYYGKRSADAEPEAKADAALLYGAYGYGAYPYAGVYGGYRTYGYPYTYGYYGKRSADAEPEAEADPALLYSTSHLVNPVTSYVASPLVSALTPAATVKTVNPVVYTAAHTPVVGSVRTVAAPVAYTAAHVAAPVTYTTAHHVVAGVPATYSALTHTPVVSVNNVPVTHTVAKREAEADPALVYTSGLVNPVTYTTAHHVAAPVTYTAAHLVAKTVVPATYTVPVATAHVAKTADHGVVAAPQGLVHSSHAGICLNNVGVQVPC